MGPMTFIVFMGTACALYWKYRERIKIVVFMVGSTILCIFLYLLIVLVPFPIVGFIGCSICGLSVGIMCQGTFNIAAAKIRKGGTAMFVLMDLAGDSGCSSGPKLVGTISDLFWDNLGVGIVTAIIFPLLLLIRIKLIKKDSVI